MVQKFWAERLPFRFFDFFDSSQLYNFVSTLYLQLVKLKKSVLDSCSVQPWFGSAMPLSKKAAKNDISKFFLFYHVDVVVYTVERTVNFITTAGVYVLKGSINNWVIRWNSIYHPKSVVNIKRHSWSVFDHLTSMQFCQANIPLLFTGALSVLNYVSFLCVRSEFHLRSLAEKKSLLHFRKVCIETINILKVLLCPFVTFRCRNSVMDSWLQSWKVILKWPKVIYESFTSN